MKRIYISGPMTGLCENNYPAFNAAAAKLRTEGWHVENPAEAIACDSWEVYMRLAIAQLVTCDAIYLLPGWGYSRGARIERALSKELGMELCFAGRELAL